MSIEQFFNPWEQKQGRIDLPKRLQLATADEQDMETLKAFEAAPTKIFHCEPNDETDYVVTTTNEHGERVVTRICHSININGIQWLITPGKNEVPGPVYEHLMQCQDNQRFFDSPQPGAAKFLGEMRKH